MKTSFVLQKFTQQVDRFYQKDIKISFSLGLIAILTTCMASVLILMSFSNDNRFTALSICLGMGEFMLLTLLADKWRNKRWKRFAQTVLTAPVKKDFFNLWQMSFKALSPQLNQELYSTFTAWDKGKLPDLLEVQSLIAKIHKHGAHQHKGEATQAIIAQYITAEMATACSNKTPQQAKYSKWL